MVDSSETQYDVDGFFSELESGVDLDKLADMLKEQPDLLNSPDLIRKLFPKQAENPDAIGRLNIDKINKAIETVKKLADKKLISPEQLSGFLNAKNPDNGETMATFMAKNAVIAYDKAFIDRSPKDNFPQEDKDAFAKQSKMYAESLNLLIGAGASLDIPNENGETVAQISAMATVKDDKGNSPILANVLSAANSAGSSAMSASQNDDELQVGNLSENGGQEALKITEDKSKEALKIKEEKKKEQPEDKNEATVEDAPEEEAGSAGDYNGSAVKEQDIIDYMYNEWFLGSLNWAINKIVGKTCNAIDNLCDKAMKKSKKSATPSPVNQNAQSFQSRSNELMRNLPNAMLAEFNAQERQKDDNFDKLKEDLKNNLGKKPQKWQYLDVNNPAHKAYIDRYNEEYSKNPKAFMKNLDMLGEHKKDFKAVSARIYKIATEMALLQYIQNEAGNKKSNLGDLTDKDVQAQIKGIVFKNVQSILSGTTAISEHTKLLSELRDKETNKEVIENNGAKSVELYLSMLEKQVAATKISTIGDVNDGNFALNNKPLSKKTTLNMSTLIKLVSDGEKHWDVLLPKDRKEAGLLTMQDMAGQINAEDATMVSALKSASLDMSAIESRSLTNRGRRSRIKAYKNKLLGNKKFSNSAENNNSIISNIISEARKRTK